jgi:hypothetical protein
MMDDAVEQDFSFFAKLPRKKHGRAISRRDDLSRLAELAKMIVSMISRRSMTKTYRPPRPPQYHLAVGER